MDSGCLSHACPLLPTDFFDALMRLFFEWHVARVPRFFVRVVPFGIVAANESPAGVLAFILIGAVQNIAMEEDGTARLQFAM